MKNNETINLKSKRSLFTLELRGELARLIRLQSRKLKVSKGEAIRQILLAYLSEKIREGEL